MAFKLPPPPRTTDVRMWASWYDAVYRFLTGALTIDWAVVSKIGSKLSDLETRPHSDLQSILGADATSSDTTQNKHISNAQAKKWEAGADAAFQAAADLLMLTPAASQGTTTTAPSYDGLYLMGGF